MVLGGIKSRISKDPLGGRNQTQATKNADNLISTRKNFKLTTEKIGSCWMDGLNMEHLSFLEKNKKVHYIG